MITIQELLYNRNLSRSAKVKLVRHKDARIDLYDVYRTDRQKYLEYQRQQGRSVFTGVEYIVSFIGEEGTLSRFVGVFKVLGETKLSHKKPSALPGCNFYGYYYDLKEVPGFEDLKERVMVDWGAGARTWHQWIDNKKEVIQIHPGLHYKQFTDYSDILLDYRELKEIISRGYEDWKKMLSVTKGIYLISDTKTGKLYVGSACGENGFWGRWATYIASNGHGNNVILRKLLAKDMSYANNFRFSILMLLPWSIIPRQAIKLERLFKRKLGTNAFGLNDN